MTYSATAPMPEGLDELMLAGFLRRQRVELVKCVTVDLEVPANSQIVLEGYVEPGERRREGPFGDHTGFYSHPDDYPVFHLTCITHRSRPIYHTTVVGIPPMEDYYLGKASERIFLPLIRKTLPEIVDMHFPAAGIFHNIVIVSIDKRYPGHARKIMNAFWGLGQLMFSKTIIVVDKDVDVQNEAEVAWIVGTHYRSGAGHPVHARAGGRSRGRERSRRVRQQDGHRRDAQVAVGRVHAPVADENSDDRRPRRRRRDLGKDCERVGIHDDLDALVDRVLQGELSDAERTFLDTHDLIAIGAIGDERPASAARAGRRSSASSRCTSMRRRRHSSAACSAGEFRIVGTPSPRSRRPRRQSRRPARSRRASRSAGSRWPICSRRRRHRRATRCGACGREAAGRQASRRCRLQVGRRGAASATSAARPDARAADRAHARGRNARRRRRCAPDAAGLGRRLSRVRAAGRAQRGRHSRAPDMTM